MTRFMTSVLLLLAVVWSASQLAAQAYEPAYALPDSGEVVMVFISTSGCVGNSHDRLDEAIRMGKALLRRQVEDEGSTFYAVGAAPQWSVEEGLRYLLEGESDYGPKNFGAWDEVQVGRNWLNTAAVDFIWGDPEGRAVVPQMLVFRRKAQPGSAGIEVGERDILIRAIGTESIIEWFDAGAPLRSGLRLP